MLVAVQRRRMAGVIARRRSTSIRSAWALPALTMPTRASAAAITSRSMRLTAAKAATAAEPRIGIFLAHHQQQPQQGLGADEQ